ncbi:MAG: pilus assembly PilX N-terminal domain-containing protein [Deltaproteobacteria bacterium]|nr:pilus assembly PilX N-terminal domain-containing protein [Deltaproteobacteria bacterium]
MGKPVEKMVISSSPGNGPQGKRALSQENGLFLSTGRDIRGYALIMAVVFVFFLTMFGFAFYHLAETDVDLVADLSNSLEAFYAAETGLEKTGWIMRHRPAIEQAGPFANLNPFSPAFYTGNGFEDFRQVAHGNSSQEGDYGRGLLSSASSPFPPYFRINSIDARVVDEADPRLMTSVRVKVLGAVDVDGDGVAGLTGTDSEGFPVDHDDVNRTFDAVIGLPGSLAENVSIGSPVFYDDAGTEITGFPLLYTRLVTQDGYDVPAESGFFYWHKSDPVTGWDRFDYVLGRPMKKGEIRLPPGLFDETGGPRAAYFSAADARQYAGDQVFDRGNDPTRGTSGREVVYVDGNVVIQDVDFGHLDNDGNLRGCDWNATDVAVISTGTITAKNIHCGNVGRLTLIARDILLVGSYDTRINGIALASGSVILDDQETVGNPHGCPRGVLKNESSQEPLRYTAYFMGTILAGTSIRLKNAGWTVLLDEKAINGLMYDATLSKPTKVYETAENEDGNFPYPRWIKHGGELGVEQESYTPEEIGAGEGASWDSGGDDTPDVMRVFQETVWNSADERHDFGLEDSVELDFEDIGIGLQDLSYYPVLTFWMSLDNFRRTSGSRETLRMFYFFLQLQDDYDKNAFFSLSEGESLYDDMNSPGEGAWKKVRIPLAGVDPTSDFNIKLVDEIRLDFYGLTISWYNQEDIRQWIDYDPDNTDYGYDGQFVFHLGEPDTYGNDSYPVRFWPPGAATYH